MSDRMGSTQTLQFQDVRYVWQVTLSTPSGLDLVSVRRRPELDLTINVSGNQVHRLPTIRLSEWEVTNLTQALHFALGVDRLRARDYLADLPPMPRPDMA